MKVGLLVVATGPYLRFAHPLAETARRYFLPRDETSIFVFSDRPETPRGTHRIELDHEAWPGPTLHRYHAYLAHRKLLSRMDYLFCCDADMLFVEAVGREILGGLVATVHPGYFASAPPELPCETRPESRAYIPDGKRDRYFAGGFVGGRTDRFLGMARSIVKMIDDDARGGIVAVWHEESYLNRHLVDHPPDVALTPSYCYPESWQLPFPRKILALDKDHAELRAKPARGIRRVLSKPFSRPRRRIAAITVTKRPHLLQPMLERLRAQERRPDVWLVYVHADAKGTDEFFNVEERARMAGIPTVFGVRSKRRTLGSVRSEAVLRAEPYGFAAVVEDDDWYGPGYFRDLERSIEAEPGADVYGIKEYDTGFARGRLKTDGRNILDRRRADGGYVIEKDRVSWCCGATLCFRVDSWLRKGLRYDDATGGEDRTIWENLERDGVIAVRRPSDGFCAVRYIHEDGFGGAHAHTSGPVFYHPPETAASLPEPPAAARKPRRPSIAVHRVPTLSPGGGVLGDLFVQDDSLAPGTVQLRGPNGRVLHEISLDRERPRRAAGLEIAVVEGGMVVYDSARDRVHFLNRTASLILELCNGRNSLEDIVAVFHARYGPESSRETEVRETIARLAAEALLVR